MFMQDLWIGQMEKDGVRTMEDGFHRRHHFRQIFLYYVKRPYVVPIEGEMSGVPQYHFLVYGETKFISHKYSLDTFTPEPLEESESLEIQKDSLLFWRKKEFVTISYSVFNLSPLHEDIHP